MNENILPLGSLAVWGEIVVEIDAVTFDGSERFYFARDANDTVSRIPATDLTPYSQEHGP